MKLNKPEKVVIITLIVFAILGAGFSFLIYPNITHIIETRDAIAVKNNQIAEAYQMISDNEELDKVYAEAIDRAVAAQKNFYPEMTATDAVKEVQRILSEGGYQDYNGVQISPISGETLTLTLFSKPPAVSYEIRQYSFLQEKQDEGEISGAQSAEGELEITREEALMLIKNKDTPPEEKKQLLDILRNMLVSEGFEIALLRANFSLNLTYKEYLSFYEYIDNLPQATSLGSIVFKDDAALTQSIREVYQFQLNLYIVKEMDMPAAINN